MQRRAACPGGAVQAERNLPSMAVGVHDLIRDQHVTPQQFLAQRRGEPRGYHPGRMVSLDRVPRGLLGRLLALARFDQHDPTLAEIAGVFHQGSCPRGDALLQQIDQPTCLHPHAKDEGHLASGWGRLGRRFRFAGSLAHVPGDRIAPGLRHCLIEPFLSGLPQPIGRQPAEHHGLHPFLLRAADWATTSPRCGSYVRRVLPEPAARPAAARQPHTRRITTEYRLATRNLYGVRLSRRGFQWWNAYYQHAPSREHPWACFAIRGRDKVPGRVRMPVSSQARSPVRVGDLTWCEPARYHLGSAPP